jgi:thiamine-monophosphate kinase
VTTARRNRRPSPFSSRRGETVAALGERELIRSIRGWLGRANPKPPAGIGDDCAVLPGSRQPQLVTVDPVIFGRHFDASVRPEDVGAKLLKRNLSDIAAMGGRPRAAVVALTLDARTRTDWVERFYRGLASTALAYGVAIVGGDVAQADGALMASLTLIGEATAPRVLTRTGARIGDWIFVTGELGNTLRSGHHCTFEPRLREGAWLARIPAVRALMDVSDGLAKDLGSLTPPGAFPAIYGGLIPRRRGADLAAALSDGEDYELLFAVDGRFDPYSVAVAWREEFALRLTCIGQFVKASRAPRDAVNLKDYRGYEHLR